jgi:hypothetical protein
MQDLGRMGQPTELMGPVLLCSCAGKYINVADIVVDNGKYQWLL